MEGSAARSAVPTQLIFPFLLINIFSFLLCFFSPLQQGNPHFLIEVIVIGEWILGSAERERDNKVSLLTKMH